MQPGIPQEEAFENLERLLNCTARKENLTGDEISNLSSTFIRWTRDRYLSDEVVSFQLLASTAHT